MSAAEFTQVWNESPSFQAVVERTGKTPAGVRSTANKLRRRGWPLKSFRAPRSPNEADLPSDRPPPLVGQAAKSLYVRLGELQWAKRKALRATLTEVEGLRAEEESVLSDLRKLLVETR